MEIHGTDILINRCIPKEEVIGAIKQFWPDCIVEDDVGEDFFVYLDQDAKDSWDREGWSEQNDDTMIYALKDKDRTTFVIDDMGENKFIIEALIEK